MAKPIVVIKFGSSTITKSTGEVNEQILEKIASQVAQLHPRYDIVLVSSGFTGRSVLACAGSSIT